MLGTAATKDWKSLKKFENRKYGKGDPELKTFHHKNYSNKEVNMTLSQLSSNMFLPSDSKCG